MNKKLIHQNCTEPGEPMKRPDDNVETAGGIIERALLELARVYLISKGWAPGEISAQVDCVVFPGERFPNGQFQLVLRFAHEPEPKR
jgi:hypothetical protein